MRVTLTLNGEGLGLYDKDVLGVTRIKSTLTGIILYTRDELHEYVTPELQTYEIVED